MNILKKLKIKIDNMPKDKLGHRVLGQYLNPIVFIGTLITTYFLSWLIGVGIIKYSTAFIGLLFCWFVHYGIERWQLKNNTGKYEIDDAKAGFSSAISYALVIMIIQVLIKFL